jgi:glycosyltransferase involved in cell wall biosynthesis
MYLASRFSLSQEKIAWVPLGVEEKIYFPRNRVRQETVFSVLHYSYYAPLHGARYVVDAACSLQNRPEIRFLMIGDGQERLAIEAMAKDRGLTSIFFMPILSPVELAGHIAGADLCLGIFGVSEKVDRVIPNKILQAMAMRKPVLTAQSGAVARYFSQKNHILFCAAGDGGAIAGSIVLMKENASLCSQIAENGYQKFQELFSGKMIAETLMDVLRTKFTI